ncbi:MAG: DUF3410 domain-containing protein, partial [Bacteroidales bacterium]
DMTLGIIGAGNVGKKVQQMARVMGMNVLVNDPPRERVEGKAGFVSLEELAERSGIVSFHVPLTHDGPDPTFRLGDKNFFDRVRRGTSIINTSRGGVIDESMLTSRIKSGQISGTVIDVWENEPEIDMRLLQLADLATPHIAGYSQDGKWNASKIIFEQFLEFFKLERGDIIIGKPGDPENKVIRLDGVGSLEEGFSRAITATYDIVSDSAKLKASPSDFESLRNNYPVRREFHAYRVQGPAEIISGLWKLGFS